MGAYIWSAWTRKMWAGQVKKKGQVERMARAKERPSYETKLVDDSRPPRGFRPRRFEQMF